MGRFEDRVLFERTILPSLSARADVHRVLFVGCEWYSKPYERLFADHEYWTLEIDPAKRRHGSRRHITDAMKNLGRHIEPEFFDLVICNGVFMRTAIETREEAEPSFAACYASLRPGGLLLLGWNDCDELRPYPPAESAELARFEPWTFTPLGTDCYVTDTAYRHAYSFYAKPG